MIGRLKCYLLCHMRFFIIFVHRNTGLQMHKNLGLLIFRFFSGLRPTNALLEMPLALILNVILSVIRVCVEKSVRKGSHGISKKARRWKLRTFCQEAMSVT